MGTKIVLPPEHDLVTPGVLANLLAEMTDPDNRNSMVWSMRIRGSNIPTRFDDGSLVQKGTVGYDYGIPHPHFSFKDVGEWLSGLGYSVYHEEDNKPPEISAKETTTGDHSNNFATNDQATAGESTNEPSGLLRLEKQILEIEKIAKILGYDPKKIPWGGKKKINKICLKTPSLFTPSGFKRAWIEANKQDRICVEGKEIYAGHPATSSAKL